MAWEMVLGQWWRRLNVGRRILKMCRGVRRRRRGFWGSWRGGLVGLDIGRGRDMAGGRVGVSLGSLRWLRGLGVGVGVGVIMAPGSPGLEFRIMFGELLRRCRLRIRLRDGYFVVMRTVGCVCTSDTCNATTYISNIIVFSCMSHSNPSEKTFAYVPVSQTILHRSIQFCLRLPLARSCTPQDKYHFLHSFNPVQVFRNSHLLFLRAKHILHILLLRRPVIWNIGRVECWVEQEFLLEFLEIFLWHAFNCRG